MHNSLKYSYSNKFSIKQRSQRSILKYKKLCERDCKILTQFYKTGLWSPDGIRFPRNTAFPNKIVSFLGYS